MSIDAFVPVKTLRKLKIDSNFCNLIESVKNLQLTTYLTRLRTKQRSNLSAQLLSIIVEVLLCAKREEKEHRLVAETAQVHSSESLPLKSGTRATLPLTGHPVDARLERTCKQCHVQLSFTIWTRRLPPDTLGWLGLWGHACVSLPPVRPSVAGNRFKGAWRESWDMLVLYKFGEMSLSWTANSRPRLCYCGVG